MPNTMKVIENLNPVDKKLFFSDLRDLDWNEFSITLWRGLKVHVLKEDINDKSGVKKYAILYYTHYTFFSLVILLIIYFILTLFGLV